MSLNVSKIKAAEYVRTIWCATVDHGFEPAKLVDPQFWANVAYLLKVGDRIEVEPESREWFAQVYVLETGAGFARVAIIQVSDLTGGQESGAIDADFSVEWKGPHWKWCVIRRSDQARVYERLPSRDAASAQLLAHVRPAAA